MVGAFNEPPGSGWLRVSAILVVVLAAACSRNEARRSEPGASMAPDIPSGVAAVGKETAGDSTVADTPYLVFR